MDLLLQKNLALTQSTLDITDAYDTSINNWIHEIERLYRLYGESNLIPADAKESLRAEHDLWGKYQEGHLCASRSMHSLPAGTMWNIKASEHAHALIREHAFLLQDFMHPIAAGRE